MFDLESFLQKQVIQCACKFRIYPTEKQKEFFAKHFGCSRFVYNYLLIRTQKAYKRRKESISKYEAKKLISPLKKTSKYSFLKEVNSQSLQAAALNLGGARERFFRREGGFPNLKRKGGRQTFEVPQNFSIKETSNHNHFLFIPKLKTGIKVKVHREIIGEMRHLTVVMEADGNYYASANCRQKVYCVQVLKKQKETGFDFGVSSLLSGSDGKKIDAPRYLRKSEKKLKKDQRTHSRKKKSSKNREKSRLKLARNHTRIKNQRADFLHQTTHKIVDENQVIYLETLCPKNMMKNRPLAKSLSDAALGALLQQIKYKAHWRGKRVVQIGRFEPSSKLCSNCGAKNNELKLHHRTWQCKVCHASHDRDINAAINIKKIGQDMSKSTPVERSASGYLLVSGYLSWLNMQEAGSGS